VAPRHHRHARRRAAPGLRPTDRRPAGRACRHDHCTICGTPIAVLRLSRDPSEPDIIYGGGGSFGRVQSGCSRHAKRRRVRQDPSSRIHQWRLRLARSPSLSLKPCVHAGWHSCGWAAGQGAYQVGVWKALWNLGIRKFCTIAGTWVHLMRSSWHSTILSRPRLCLDVANEGWRPGTTKATVDPTLALVLGTRADLPAFHRRRLVVALLRAARSRHGDDHRPFPHAAQTPRGRWGATEPA
jgi:hypothetical protein